MNNTATAQNAQNGAFISQCETHCEALGGAWASFTVGGVVMRDAVAAWMASPADAAPAWAVDCHLNVHLPPNPSPDARLCNPTCGLHCDSPPGSICAAERLAVAPDPMFRKAAL